jgi:hypothetical protein
MAIIVGLLSAMRVRETPAWARGPGLVFQVCLRPGLLSELIESLLNEPTVIQ